MNFEVSDIQVNDVLIKGVKILGDKTEQGERNSTHTIILLDVSGSMDESHKLKNVKKSLNFLIKFLQPNDRLTLITFNSMSQIQIQNMNVTTEYLATFQHVINTIQAYGGTNLSSGLINVKSVLERCAVENQNISKTGLIILTDGHANEGLSRSEDILRIIESVKISLPSLTITTIGYNEDHNAELLKSIAVNGGGSYNIVNNSDQVATVFGEILGGLMTTVVQNCYVKFDSTWKSLNMYTSTESNGQTIMNIGDINAESETILLFTNTNNSNSILTVTGVKTKDFTTITQELLFNASTISQNKQPYHITYIRLVVANILQNLKTLTKEYVRDTLKPIKEYLEQPINLLHPLTSYLKQEITSIENQLETPSCINTTQNLQQSICMAFGRGTSCARNIEPVYQTPLRRRAIRFEDIDVDNTLNTAMTNMNVNLATPFANRAQREVSQYAVNYTQDVTDATDPDVEL